MSAAVRLRVISLITQLTVGSVHNPRQLGSDHVFTVLGGGRHEAVDFQLCDITKKLTVGLYFKIVCMCVYICIYMYV